MSAVAITSPGESRDMWAAVQDVLREQQGGPALVALRDQGRSPLSSSQERLWFICESLPGTAAYNLPFAWKLRGDISATALRLALCAVMRRHKVFHTTFTSTDGRPFQTVVEFKPIDLDQRDFKHLPEAPRRRAVQEWMREEAARPFDLSRLPLMRAALLHTGEREFVLLLVFHHIIFDGWSRQVFFRELKAEYVANLTGTPASVPEPPLQYADFAAWDRERAGAIAQRQLGFWKQSLAGPLPLLDLALDRPRPAMATGSGAVHHFLLPARACAALDALRSETGTTRFVVLLAVFQTLLHRYTEQEDLVVGTASANRSRPELRQMIGFFVNSLALRSRPCADMPFRELLRQTQQTAFDAFAHQDLPFEKIVEAVNPARSPGRSPLFDTMFVLQNASRSELELPGIDVQPIRVHNGAAKFDLTFELYERGNEITGAIEFNTDIFDRSSVRWMARHFAQLIDSAAASPDTPLAQLPMLTPRERRRFVEWNNTVAPYPRERPVHELFEKNAAQFPGAAAMEFGEESWSYAELNGAANALARRLVELGVRPGTLVAICAERSPLVITAMLAVLKAGGAYVPLDPKYPAERLAYMMTDSRAPVLIVQRKCRGLVPSREAQVVLLDEERSPVTENIRTPNIGGESLAYVIYTSGSTGNPKGVCVTHRGINRLVLNTNYLQIKPQDVVAQAASTSFDAATFEIWGPLLNGARLVIIPRDVVLSPQDFAAELRARGVTVLFLTTALFNVMARAEPGALGSVRSVLFGGEAADANAVQALIERGAPGKLLNVYGPTETTTFATCFDAQQLGANSGNVPIGLPIANTDVHIFDRHRQPAAIGTRGELFIGGDGVARGYWNQPELSAEKFVEREVLTPQGIQRQRLYRTGDIVRRLPNGHIEFLGRADNQVKIRGFRVEPGEIEAALKQHRAVTDAVVVAHDAGGDKRLVAYVTTDEAQLNADDARRWLAAKLPEHMVPAHIVVLEFLPLNANGKVDRASLPPPDTSTPAQIVEVKPWIPLQLQLLQIWRELLGINSVGVRDDFFELGGHSLLAVRLIDRIEQVCGLKIPVSTLFTASTVEQLSEVILKQQFGDAKPLIEIQPTGSRAPIFFLHGDLLGGGLYCLNLARQLGQDHPFFAIPPARMDGANMPGIGEMAAEHLRVIRAHTPHGPYILGGFCIAGLVALEMAQRLEADGERVEMLVLADPPVPSFMRFARQLVEMGSRINRAPIDEQLKDFFTCYTRLCLLRELWSASHGERWTFIKRRLNRRRSSSSSRADPNTARDLRAAYLWAAAGYRPRLHRGRAQLFCCDDVMVPLKTKLRAWRRLLPEAETHVVAGEHLDLVTTRADELAGQLRSALEHSRNLNVLKAVSSCAPLAIARR